MGTDKQFYSISDTTFKAALFRKELVICSDSASKILSIFEHVAGEDKTIDKKEWEMFVKEFDTNGNGEISDEEIKNNSADLMMQIKNIKESEITKFVHLIHDINNKKNATMDEMRQACLKDENKLSKIDGIVSYMKPTKNSYRAVKTWTGGTFTDNWIKEDAYGSTTCDEWLKNNGYTINNDLADKMIKEIFTKFKISGLRYRCSRAVTDSLSAITVGTQDIIKSDKDDNNGETMPEQITAFQGIRQKYAYQNASEYSKNPLFKELPNNIVANMNLKALPKGSVIVYDAGYKISPRSSHPYGHIGIADGMGYECSFERAPIKISKEKQAGYVRVFIPVIQNEKQEQA